MGEHYHRDYLEGRKLSAVSAASHILIPIPTRKEGNILNNALNTFHLRFYGVRHMFKDHSDSERGNPLPPHGLLFPINSKGSFICTDRITHTTAFVTPVVEHWLELYLVPHFN